MGEGISLSDALLETGTPHRGVDTILTDEACEFVAKLTRAFRDRRDELLDKRVERQAEIDAGVMPDFLPETRAIRESDWTVAPVPEELQDRRVEITGPVDRKMIINALNSGAMVFMADFEDSNSPTWNNCIEGQINLFDAIRGVIEHKAPNGKHYWLNQDTATLMVRPRGWHLEERHFLVDGKPVPASLFDFGLFFFHNAAVLLDQGTGPYFYLPKLESHLEARLWNDVFNLAQDELGIARGTIKATVLIETILAAFEMHEILYELQDHSAGLNCGRWDYIFSFIKKFRNHERFVLPDRAAVTMTAHCMRSYSKLLIETCHRRGAHAMGGMAAQIPIKGNEIGNELALSRVREDKEREARDGHDGTWVAHPGLIPIAMDVFDRRMPRPNQLHRRCYGPTIAAKDLLAVPKGDITAEGLATNIAVGLRYLESWLRGSGCVPINHLMEDAATAEISRAQLWQWIHHGASLVDGTQITADLVRDRIRTELDELRDAFGPERFAETRFDLAAEIFEQTTTESRFVDFLTLPAYDHI